MSSKSLTGRRRKAIQDYESTKDPNALCVVMDHYLDIVTITEDVYDAIDKHLKIPKGLHSQAHAIVEKYTTDIMREIDQLKASKKAKSKSRSPRRKSRSPR